MTITKTFIEGLTPAMLQARLNLSDAKPFLFGTYFPTRMINSFSWGTIQNAVSSINVAADVQADGASMMRKARPIMESAKGDLPYIAISREMTRAQLKEYQVARALQGDDATALIDYWANDVEFAWRGVNAQLDFLAWSCLSNAGRLILTPENNATFATEFALDYDVYDFQKTKTETDWNTPSTADIVGDLAKIIQEARKKGLHPKFAFVSLNTFYKIASSDQIKKLTASFLSNMTGVLGTPDVNTLNTALANQAWLNGLQFRVIDTDVTREYADGTQRTQNPFADDVLVLTETEVLGQTQYSVLEESNPSVTRAVRSHVVIKKFGDAERVTEVTSGHADALPVLNTAYRNVYVKTNATEWT